MWTMAVQMWRLKKAEGVDNIPGSESHRRVYGRHEHLGSGRRGKFYTFNLHYAPFPERFSFVIDKEKTQRVAILDERERSKRTEGKDQTGNLEKRIPLDLGLKDKNAGMEFEVGNIFIDGDILLLRMTLTNRTQIGYTTDFMRFYIQDAKIHKKTAVQQIEQNILFAFDYPEEIPAHESRTFTVAMNKFTIPDKKRLIIEIQERNGGRHFLYKLKNKSLLGAEEVFRSLQEQKTEDEAEQDIKEDIQMKLLMLILFFPFFFRGGKRKGTARYGTGKMQPSGKPGSLPGHTLPVRGWQTGSLCHVP